MGHCQRMLLLKCVCHKCICQEESLIPMKLSESLGKVHRGLAGGRLLLRNFSVAISVSPRVYFILVIILISMFLR